MMIWIQMMIWIRVKCFRVQSWLYSFDYWYLCHRLKDYHIDIVLEYFQKKYTNFSIVTVRESQSKFSDFRKYKWNLFFCFVSLIGTNQAISSFIYDTYELDIHSSRITKIQVWLNEIALKTKSENLIKFRQSGKKMKEKKVTEKNLQQVSKN